MKKRIKKDKIKEFLDEVRAGSDEPLLYPTGFEKAIIGTVERCGMSILLDRDKMSQEEAIELFYYNISGTYMGEGTPAFASLIK